MSYFTDAAPDSGPRLYTDTSDLIDVMPDRDGRKFIGRATCVGWLPEGAALWRLRIDGAELSGLWVVIDREFRPA
jgi:hypothetical protein